MEAKAKRLARFHVELSQTEEQLSEFSRKVSGNKINQAQPQAVKFSIVDSTRKPDSLNGGLLPDYEGLESYTPIHGVCPDMCPGIFFFSFCHWKAFLCSDFSLWDILLFWLKRVMFILKKKNQGTI